MKLFENIQCHSRNHCILGISSISNFSEYYKSFFTYNLENFLEASLCLPNVNQL